MPSDAQYSVRLSGGPSPSKGRVEVMPEGRWLSGASWTPFCDDEFTDGDATTICGLLGYAYGRKYYDGAVTFLSATEPRIPFRASRLYCETELDFAPPPHDFNDAPQRRSSRRMLALDEFGEYDPEIVGRRPYDALVQTQGQGRLPECSLTVRRYCPPPGHLAGAECSDVPFETAPPPMALPPSPPPPPPSKSPFAKYVAPTSQWSPWFGDGSVEPNLCTPTDDVPYCPGRAELLVADPSDPSQPVWAPLCGFDQAAFPKFAQQLATHFCYMVGNMPAIKSTGTVVEGQAGDQSYAIPTSPVTEEGYFDPSKVRLWASLPQPSDSQGLYEPARLIQDSPGFTLSSEPCPSGKLFTVDCSQSVYD
ncbi:hypothetical protein HYH03_007278 [Edaphochlamys debaryana]|uniref:SRCR domain-containing protein n=1 Tax=Edaphochlamys debaryana TaxID=47281 RepID=A0A835Y8T1_9CHLO|nr:hypothetical protein HYH03_007278 [Edaphochlamys debaryana]|eukprot:KAG2494510.1 hypothetical protein HYH03_007278 [Edaphochlamys debaryana]